MLGLGKWKFDLKTMIYTGEAQIELYDNNGQYGLRILKPEMETPQITVKELVEKDDTIKAVISVSLLPHSNLTLVFQFTDNTVEGYVKVPFLGKIPIKGVRIDD